MPNQDEHQYVRSHTLSAEHLLFDLDAAKAELRATAVDGQNRRAITLMRQHGASVVMTQLEDGASLEEHAAPGVVTVQVLSGHVHVLVGSDQIDAPAGNLVALDMNVRHRVHAVEESTLLLTLSAPPSGAPDAS